MSDNHTARNLWTTYTAVRFATGRKAKGVAGPAAKASGGILAMLMLAPLALLEWFVRSIGEARRRQAAERIPRTAGGYPRRQTDMEDLLHQMMEED